MMHLLLNLLFYELFKWKIKLLVWFVKLIEIYDEYNNEGNLIVLGLFDPLLRSLERCQKKIIETDFEIGTDNFSENARQR